MANGGALTGVVVGTQVWGGSSGNVSKHESLEELTTRLKSTTVLIVNKWGRDGMRHKGRGITAHIPHSYAHTPNITFTSENGVSAVPPFGPADYESTRQEYDEVDYDNGERFAD